MMLPLPQGGVARCKGFKPVIGETHQLAVALAPRHGRPQRHLTILTFLHQQRKRLPRGAAPPSAVDGIPPLQPIAAGSQAPTRLTLGQLGGTATPSDRRGQQGASLTTSATPGGLHRRHPGISRHRGRNSWHHPNRTSPQGHRRRHARRRGRYSRPHWAEPRSGAQSSSQILQHLWQEILVGVGTGRWKLPLLLREYAEMLYYSVDFCY